MSREPGAGAGRGADDVNIRCRELLRIVHEHVSRDYPDLDPEDVAQETLARFLSRRRRLGPTKSMGAVLVRIADRVAREMRSDDRSERDALSHVLDPPGVESAEDRVVWRSVGTMLRDGLALVKPSDREIVLLKRCGEFDGRALGKHLHISHEAARQRAHRAEQRYMMRVKELGFVWVLLSWAAGVLRRIAKSPVGGPVTAGAVALAVGAAILAPHDEPDADVIGQQPQKPSFSSTVLPADRGHGSSSSPQPFHRDRTAPSAPKAPAATPPSLEPPGTGTVQSHLELHPGTGPGRKREHWVRIDAPATPITAEGKSFATGPALVHPACTKATTVCSRAEELATVEVDSTRAPQP